MKVKVNITTTDGELLESLEIDPFEGDNFARICMLSGSEQQPRDVRLNDLAKVIREIQLFTASAVVECLNSTFEAE